jgi:hypothetical protein
MAVADLPIEITFTLETRDFTEALRLGALRGRGRLLREPGAASLILLLLLVFWVATDQPRKIVAILAAGVVLLPLAILSVVALQLRRQAARQALRGVTGLPITWRFGAETIEASCGATRTTFSWKQWIGFLEAGDYVLLFSSPEQFHILPKRAFKTAEEALEFRKLLESKPQR